ncbi:hypothetical protein [Thalassobaculum sp.]|uniref:hypothetical protein n=1 Tax=Thalassobaculum sp. TaxID=2022740 RepID=UPI003B5AA4BC
MATLELSPDEQALVERAHQRLLVMLAEHENVVSMDHSAALRGLLWLMTAKALGKLTGRHVAPLPTGSGKTTAIIAWVTELVLTWDDEIPICVSMFTVEALCRLYRSLLNAGVGTHDVGLIHSLGEKAPEASLKRDPDTKEYPSRQVMLVSHSRLRDGDLNQFYPAGALTIFDESLVTSESVVINAETLHSAYGAIKPVTSKFGLIELERYLQQYSQWYEATPIGQQEAAVTFDFPALSTAEVRTLHDQVRSFDTRISDSARFRDALRKAIQCNGQTGRLLRDGTAKIVIPQPNFPDELEDMLILDASYLMKIAERFNATIVSGEDALQETRSHDVDLSSFKRYDNVRIKVLPVPSGRTSIRRDLNSGKGAILEEVIECVRRIPPGESVLIVTFKDLGRSDLSGKDYLTSQLRSAGISTDPKAPDDPADRPRINVLTWGQEASLNDFSHCQHVILYGLHFRDSTDLAGLYFGAKQDLSVRYGPRQTTAHVHAEAAQSAFQALSRGSCRTMVDGQAKPMTGYIMTPDQHVLEYLGVLMPGAQFVGWPAVVPHARTEQEREVQRIRRLMTDHFNALFSDGKAMRVTGVQLRKLIDPEDKIPKKSRQRLIDEAMEGMLWFKRKRSYEALDLRDVEAREFMGQVPEEELKGHGP